MVKRSRRHDVIRMLVRERQIKTQKDLVDALAEHGFDCTQATISRDISELGLHKLPEGVYILSEDMHLRRMISDLAESIQHANNLVLVKCRLATAPGIAAAIDAADLPGVMATIAGDDVVLIVVQDEPTAITVEELLEKLLHQEA